MYPQYFSTGILIVIDVVDISVDDHETDFEYEGSDGEEEAVAGEEPR